MLLGAAFWKIIADVTWANMLLILGMIAVILPEMSPLSIIWAVIRLIC